MAVSSLVVNIDDFDKMKFNAFCSDIGLDASSVINMFVKTVIRENCIPFLISRNSDPFYSKKNIDYIMKSVQELKDGKGTPHELIEA